MNFKLLLWLTVMFSLMLVGMFGIALGYSKDTMAIIVVICFLYFFEKFIDRDYADKKKIQRGKNDK